MSTSNETGHARIVANFEQLVTFCTKLGTAFNPAKASIKLAAISAQLASARAALVQVNTNLVTHNNAINTRVIAFSNIKKLSTRLVNGLVASGASKEMVDDARAIQRKIYGTRAKLIIPNSGADLRTDTDSFVSQEPHHISASQQSYDNLIEHFARMLLLLNSQTSYAPNEAELKLTALNTYLTSLRTTNSDVYNSYYGVSNARLGRDTVLYHLTTGVCSTAKEVKSYLKFIYGATAPQYRQITGLQFKLMKF